MLRGPAQPGNPVSGPYVLILLCVALGEFDVSDGEHMNYIKKNINSLYGLATVID